MSDAKTMDHKQRMMAIETFAKLEEAKDHDAPLAYLWRQYKREEKLRTVQRTFLDDVALAIYAQDNRVRGPRECYELAKAFIEARGEFVK